MEEESIRERCNKKGCQDYAVAVLTVYTSGGAKAIACCKSHLFSLSGIIDALIASMIET
ncbi:MAG: hypothetical protein V3T23_04670 [Nitrososphaerales archaeon]